MSRGDELVELHDDMVRSDRLDERSKPAVEHRLGKTRRPSAAVW